MANTEILYKPRPDDYKLKIIFMKCLACEQITPQYEQSNFEFNCIYEDCEKHIPFWEIVKLSKKKEELQCQDSLMA